MYVLKRNKHVYTHRDKGEETIDHIQQVKVKSETSLYINIIDIFCQRINKWLGQSTKLIKTESD